VKPVASVGTEAQKSKSTQSLSGNNGEPSSRPPDLNVADKSGSGAIFVSGRWDVTFIEPWAMGLISKRFGKDEPNKYVDVGPQSGTPRKQMQMPIYFHTASDLGANFCELMLSSDWWEADRNSTCKISVGGRPQESCDAYRRSINPGGPAVFQVGLYYIPCTDFVIDLTYGGKWFDTGTWAHDMVRVNLKIQDIKGGAAPAGKPGECGLFGSTDSRIKDCADNFPGVSSQIVGKSPGVRWDLVARQQVGLNFYQVWRDSKTRLVWGAIVDALFVHDNFGANKNSGPNCESCAKIPAVILDHDNGNIIKESACESADGKLSTAGINDHTFGLPTRNEASEAIADGLQSLVGLFNAPVNFSDNYEAWTSTTFLFNKESFAYTIFSPHDSPYEICDWDNHYHYDGYRGHCAFENRDFQAVRCVGR